MKDVIAALKALHRPRLLIRAARQGADAYRRELHLARLLGRDRLPGTGLALARLLELESDLDAARREGAAGYSLPAHVEVLIALMGEARTIPPAGLAP